MADEHGAVLFVGEPVRFALPDSHDSVSTVDFSSWQRLCFQSRALGIDGK